MEWNATRRGFLAGAGSAVVAGCTGLVPANEGTDDGPVTITDFRGSGPLVESRSAPGGTAIADLPDLSGDLTVYLGGGESGLYTTLFDLFERIYPEFSVSVQPAPSSQLANTIIEEHQGGASPADVFIAVDAGSLGAVADAGAAGTLPGEVTDPVPDAFKADNWVGLAGRARAIPYNTEQFSADDIPTDVMAFAEDERFQGTMGWAPTYGAFQAFVTAMRILEGEDRTRQWLKGMLDQNVESKKNEFLISNFVAEGELGAGFANHYYSLRVQRDRQDAPLALAFTENDAGALVNVSGALPVAGTDSSDLVARFVRHLLSAEAQEFFATRTFGYPMIPGVPPVGDLPRVDELSPPDLDLSKLSDLEPTLALLREVGAL